MQHQKHIMHNRATGLGSPLSLRLVGQLLACAAAFAFVTALVCGVM